MIDDPLTPNAIAALDGSAAAAVVWRSKGQLYVTAIAKATFAFMPDGPMPRAEPQEIVHAEIHHGKDPGRSVRLTSDLAPYLSRVDVLFTGSAHAPPEAPARAVPVRLAIFGDKGPLLDKRLLVQDAADFQRMPIVYERALGGIDERENPLGLAPTAGAPNILDPAHPERPAGFGPIARAWPARKRLLGATPRKALDEPIADIPEGFDWSYFQAAPPDQQIAHVHGDEWIVLEGLHPARPRFRTHLPGVRGVARVHGLAAFGVPDGQPLELVTDTLRIDGDEQRCTVVCRRSFPIASEAALAVVRVAAGVEVAGEALAWPDPRVVWRAKAAPAVVRGSVSTGTLVTGTTLVVPAEAAAQASLQPVIPFHPATGQEADRRTVRREPVEHVFTGTLSLPPEANAGPDRQKALPFRGPALKWSASEPVFITEQPRIINAPSSPAVTQPQPQPLPLPQPQPQPQPQPLLQPPAETEPETEAKAPELSIERYAAISAEIAEARSPRAKVVRDHELTERAWTAVERRWIAAIADDVARGSDTLRSASDSAYVAAVERFRGPITEEEYARLVVGVERGRPEPVLDELKIQRPALMRVIRVWTRKVAADARLVTKVRGMIAAVRRQ